MRAARLLIGALGVAVAAWGAWLLLDTQDAAELRGIALWLGGGVLVHDVLLAPATLVLSALGARVLPVTWRGVAATSMVIIGTVSVMAIPVLGGFGADYDAANTTILDRDFLAGWALIGVLTVVASVGAFLGRSRPVEES